jgi:hypothetical protein
MKQPVKVVYPQHVYRTAHGIVVPGLMEQFEAFVGSQVHITIERVDGLPKPAVETVEIQLSVAEMSGIVAESVLAVCGEALEELRALRLENAELKSSASFTVGIPV